MPSTFNVISLGKLADIDTTEGNHVAEGASALVGKTFGTEGEPLVDDFATLSALSVKGGSYNMNNKVDETFRIDGGTGQTFDGVAVYNATLTFLDGSTANFTAVVFQDTDGNTYLAPEFSDNADQDALESGPIMSFSIDGLLGNKFYGLYSSRESWDFVTCFVRGTRIQTINGSALVQDITTGDFVDTADHGPQPVRWTGRTTVAATGALAPIRFRAGVLGNHADLRVSPQHRMLISGWRAELHFGTPEVLVPAKHLLNGDTVRRDEGGSVEYFHLLFDRHELIFSEGIATESFHPGAQSLTHLDRATREEIFTLFPQLRNDFAGFGPLARPTVKAKEAIVLHA